MVRAGVRPAWGGNSEEFRNANLILEFSSTTNFSTQFTHSLTHSLTHFLFTLSLTISQFCGPKESERVREIVIKCTRV